MYTVSLNAVIFNFSDTSNNYKIVHKLNIGYFKLY